MGGCCCCCSKGVELNSSPRLYHYPVAAEERQPLSPHNGTTSALIVDTNLETSIPDTYRPPPVPLPYDLHVGNSRSPLDNLEISGNKREAPVQTTSTEPVTDITEVNISNIDESRVKESKESGCKEQTDKEDVTKEVDLENEKFDELEKSGELKKSSEPIAQPEECPTCLEEYDEDNPKIITKCEHHFHLSCILEWLERSDTCPVCDQEMVISFPVAE